MHAYDHAADGLWDKLLDQFPTEFLRYFRALQQRSALVSETLAIAQEADVGAKGDALAMQVLTKAGNASGALNAKQRGLKKAAHSVELRKAALDIVQSDIDGAL